MASRKKSLFAAMLPKPKRRSAKRSTSLFPMLSVPAVKPVRPAAKRAPSKPVRTKTAVAPAVRKPKPPVKPGGAGSWRSARYVGPAGSRGYFVYVPPGLRRTTAVPLMVMLHGCTQTPAEFAAATRFNQLADRQGFVVVYPHQTITHNMQRCWNWFEPRHQSRLAGEPAIIAGIVETLIADRKSWRIDPTRVYVAGISAGGGMAVTLGASYPDLFAGVGVHSGPAYRSASGGSTALSAMAAHTPMPDLSGIPARETGLPPMIVFQGAGDFTIRAANAARLTDQWLEVQEGATGPADPARITRSRVTKNVTGTRTSTVTKWYSARGRVGLECWLVSGLGHAWSGGLKKGSFSDPLGPRATTVMWRFLAVQRLGGRP